MLEQGIAQAKRTGADIVLGTNADSNRVGIAVKTDDGYREQDYDSLVGYEESYSYFVGTHATTRMQL